MGFVKLLRDVVPRLALMGVTLDQVRLEYERAAADSDEMEKQLEESGLEKTTPCMPFDEFLELAKLIDISNLDASYDKNSLDKDPSEYGTKFVGADLLKAIPQYDPFDAMVYSEQ